MRWIGNKYVDADGRIVAEVKIRSIPSPMHKPTVECFEAWTDTAFRLGNYISEADAMRAVERWWNERQVESFRLEEKA